MDFRAQWIALLVAAAVGGAFQWAPVRRVTRSTEHRLRLLLHRPLWGWLLVAMASLVVNTEITLHRGIPTARIQDEFSYLLAADTFSHGRLTNPAHPLWRAFQTFHELQQPTYMSKYPPGHGLVLAAGQVLAGEPVVGAWLEAALLCVGAGWMLFGFLPATESVLGALAVAMSPLVLHWSQIYWGGSLAATGGCFVLGAWARLLHSRGWQAGVALGVGFSLLAITRPYEGLLFALPFVGWAVVRPRPGVLAAAAVLVCFGGWLLYDNHRVTGHALQLPYTTYERQYALAPSFLWQHVRPAHPFDRDTMRQMTVAELRHFHEQRHLRGFFDVLVHEKLANLRQELVQPWLTWVLLLGIPAALASDRRLRWPIAAAGLVLAGTMVSNWTRSQYIAPALPAVVLLVAAALYRAAGRYPALARGVGAGILAGMIAGIFAKLPPSRVSQRPTVEQSLLAMGGKHLVIVQYLPGHNVDDEWVYNAADIDASPIVWAADLGPAEDLRLTNYFADRTMWHVTIDGTAAHTARYTPAP